SFTTGRRRSYDHLYTVLGATPSSAAASFTSRRRSGRIGRSTLTLSPGMVGWNVGFVGSGGTEGSLVAGWRERLVADSAREVACTTPPTAYLSSREGTR